MSALSRGIDSDETILQMAGTLYLRGHTLDLERANTLAAEETRSRAETMASTQHLVLTDLPNYPWDHDTLIWQESRMIQEYKQRKYPRHILLGSRIPGNNGKTITWRNFLTVSESPWLEDHKLGSTVVFPAAGHLAIAIEAIRQISATKNLFSSVLEFRNVKILNALVLLNDVSGIEIMTELRPRQISASHVSQKWWDFEISSHDNNTCKWIPRI